MHLAVQKSNTEIVKLLLENPKINAKIEDSNRKMPIDYSQNDEITQLLSKNDNDFEMAT